MVYIYDTVSRHIIKSYSLCHSHTKYGVATYLPEGADPEAALRVPDPMNLDPQHRFTLIDTVRRHIIIDDIFMSQIYN